MKAKIMTMQKITAIEIDAISMLSPVIGNQGNPVLTFSRSVCRIQYDPQAPSPIVVIRVMSTVTTPLTELVTVHFDPKQMGLPPGLAMVVTNGSAFDNTIIAPLPLQSNEGYLCFNATQGHSYQLIFNGFVYSQQ